MTNGDVTNVNDLPSAISCNGYPDARIYRSQVFTMTGQKGKKLFSEKESLPTDEKGIVMV